MERLRIEDIEKAIKDVETLKSATPTEVSTLDETPVDDTPVNTPDDTNNTPDATGNTEDDEVIE